MRGRREGKENKGNIQIGYVLQTFISWQKDNNLRHEQERHILLTDQCGKTANQVAAYDL